MGPQLHLAHGGRRPRILSDQRMYLARLNVYPLPAMSAWKLKPGCFLGYGRNRDTYLGVSLDLAPMGLSGL